jgi:hypothetical protein
MRPTVVPVHGALAEVVSDRCEPVAVDRYIADVLRTAHQTAEAVDETDEARAILHVAHLFAEKLAETDPDFDRLQFLEAITREPA